MTDQVTPLPGPGPEAGYRLVRDASTQFRRTGARVGKLRKQLADALARHKESERALKLAIEAVQAALPLDASAGDAIDPRLLP